MDSSTEHDDATFRFSHTPGVAEFLMELGASLLVSTYQAGKLITLRAHPRRDQVEVTDRVADGGARASDGQLSMLLRSFDQAMGIAVGEDRIAIGTGHQVWTLWNSPSVAAKLNTSDEFRSEYPYDACYMPRSAHVTGAIDVHEMAWGRNDELWLVNTHFSCLCTLGERFSFVPRWRPPFVSRLAREDRCHLNGLAMQAGRPKYVTCFGETDVAEGWRPEKLTGGCVIDIGSGEVVTRGLAMPHSPRCHAGKLWVLNSGCGTLITVDPESGQQDVVVELPGYTRGLCFAGRYALVGLSKIRDTAVFGGVPIAEKYPDRPCGVAVVDTIAGRQVGLIEFEESIREVFDVALLPGVRWPAVVGLEKETIQHASVIGPEMPFAA